MAKTVSITASSKMSIQIQSNFYTMEYSETRSIDAKDNLEVERQKLWDAVNTEVDEQVQDVLEMWNKKSRKKR